VAFGLFPTLVMGLVDGLLHFIRNILLAIAAIIGIIIVAVLAFLFIKCCCERTARASKDE